jgi:3-phytase
LNLSLKGIVVRTRISIVLAVIGLAGCGGGGEPPPIPSPVIIEEAWRSPEMVAANLDSPAVAQSQGWLVTTAKGTHQLVVFDAATGEVVRLVGGPGAGPGEFQRPNGVAVFDDLVFVVERDNRRVQVLRLPDFEPVTTFGEEELERPYGIAVDTTEPAHLGVYVTDMFELIPDDDPTNERLAARVKLYRIEIDGDTVLPVFDRSFGEVGGEGALLKVETIGVDPDLDRVLIAEEHPSLNHFKIYDLNGAFTGEIAGSGLFTGEPEGVALWRCDGQGYWLTTDQHNTTTVFHVLDRVSMSHLGAFSGPGTANTDGVALTREPLPGFPAGAFFAIHDDRSVSAFDLREIAHSLELSADCASAD